uniref:Ubiquitin-like domain-containing protein n=1 Tax=Ditylenchus dipsaci TaxID=166011 RepID=A0A915DIU1_9BILA
MTKRNVPKFLKHHAQKGRKAQVRRQIKVNFQVFSCNRDKLGYPEICGLNFVKGEFLMISATENQYFILPMVKMKDSCTNCGMEDLKSLLEEFLTSDKTTKWIPDSLEFLRSIRSLFSSCSIKTRSVGCVRTLECLVMDSDVPIQPIKLTIRDMAKRFNCAPPEWAVKIIPDIEPAIINSAIDAYLTHVVALKLLSSSSARMQNLQSLYLQSLEVVSNIELFGIAFDKDKCKKLSEKIVSQMTIQEKRVFQCCGEKFNLDSSGEVAKILFSKMKLSIPNNAGNTRRHLSTSADVLKQIDHPICDMIIKWRRLENALAALTSLLHAAKKYPDNRIRTAFDNYSASAGRILSSNPDMHVLPKDPIISHYSTRSVLIAPQGCIFVAADYCQLELRVLCQLSSDKSLAKLLNAADGVDPFDKMATMFSTEEVAISRQKSKQLCYAIIYGMGSDQSIFQLFPKIKCWIESRMDKCRETLYAETFLGRKKQFTSTIGDIQKDDKKIGRQCINYIIQGTASEMFRKALIYTDKRLQEQKFHGRIVMQIHDELIVEVPQECVEQTAIILKDSMEKAFQRFLKDGEQAKLRFPVKLSAGQNWGHLERLDYCDVVIKTRDEKTLPLAVDRTCTVKHLVARIQKITGTEGKHQFLIFQGQQLEDEMSLAHYNIEQDCLLAFTDRLRAGGDRSAAPFYITVFIDHNGQKQGYSLPENATVQQLMKRIQVANGGQRYKQFLSLNGLRLCLLRPLSFYKIDDDSVIQLNDVCYPLEKPKKISVIRKTLVKLGLRRPPKIKPRQMRRIRVPAIAKFGPYMLPANPRKARAKEHKPYYYEDDDKVRSQFKDAYFGDDDETKAQAQICNEREDVESVKSVAVASSYNSGLVSSNSSDDEIPWETYPPAEEDNDDKEDEMEEAEMQLN